MSDLDGHTRCFREQQDGIHSSEYQRLYLHTCGPQLRHENNEYSKETRSETVGYVGLRHEPHNSACLDMRLDLRAWRLL